MAASQVKSFAGYSVRPFDANSRLVTTHDQGYFLVSYNTPVAVYDRETDVLCTTEAKYSRATTTHIREFGETFRPGKVQPVPQAYIDGLFRHITGFIQLA